MALPPADDQPALGALSSQEFKVPDDASVEELRHQAERLQALLHAAEERVAAMSAELSRERHRADEAEHELMDSRQRVKGGGPKGQPLVAALEGAGWKLQAEHL